MTATVAALLALGALCGCRPNGPAERGLDPAIPAANRPVVTLGPDDAVATGNDPPATVRPRAEATTPPAPSGCDPDAAGDRRCTPSPRP